MITAGPGLTEPGKRMITAGLGVTDGPGSA
jgi:hypothetical protein